MRKKKGVQPFLLSAKTVIDAGAYTSDATLFVDLLYKLTGIRPQIAGADAAASKTCCANNAKSSSNACCATEIKLAVNPELFSAAEGDKFIIDINPKVTTVTGNTTDALFLGLTTLAKEAGAGSCGAVAYPACTLTGQPAFNYRGAHFDVCRHFFNKDQVKTFIDMLALHGLNTFHWHLNDDQGWRIEIKKYPRLIEIGSHRDSTTILRNSGKWDYTPVDGFFTQDDAREIVKYAADRHIRVIPEIDLPGHMRAALAAYPELGCTGGPYSVWTEWGVTEDVLCPGKPQTMQFISDVLNEIMDIFPDSEIIHIGGDECPKDNWKTCPDCQALIKKLKIKAKGKYSAEDRLQGYVTRHAYDVCHARGRKAIGWDEILEADIPQDAIVMSWRGLFGANEGLKHGNDVVLAPNYCMYFDFYQTKDTDLEPFAIGGFTPVERVYAFDPWEIEDGKPAGSKGRILGVQANLWTEYIPTFSQVQYMELPRMSTLAEVQWQHRGEKDYEEYLTRMPSILKIYDRLGWNFARHIMDPVVTYTPAPESKTLTVGLKALNGSEIRYTLDGNDPTDASPLYTKPLSIADPTRIKFASFTDGNRGRVLGDSIHVNKASFRAATLNSKPAPGYEAQGANTLVDGITGTYNYRTWRWLGYNAEPLDVTIDLGSPQEVNEVGFNVAVFACDGVVDYQDATVMLSDDGQNFTTVLQKTNDPILPEDEFVVKEHTLSLSQPATARYVRLKVTPLASLPAWHHLATYRGFLFVDEVSVR